MKKFIEKYKINLFLKGALLFLLLYFLYRHIFLKENIEVLWVAFKEEFQKGSLLPLIVAILLMPINWGFETQKWRILLRHIENIPFRKAWRAVMAGVTLSVFTPNRVGEYGGRVLLIGPGHKVQAIIATLVGSFSQLIVLMSAGAVGLVWFISFKFQPELYIFSALSLASIVLIFMMTFCYMNIDLVVPLFKKIPYLKKRTKYVEVLQSYSWQELLKVLLLSVARYAVYSWQYYLMLQFFGVVVPVGQGFACIAVIFLMQTSIPMPPMFALVMRSEVALMVWEHFNANEISIIASTFSVWVLNIVFPAILGMIFILYINITKSIGDEFESETPENK